jgi:hypothetical protein
MTRRAALRGLALASVTGGAAGVAAAKDIGRPAAWSAAERLQYHLLSAAKAAEEMRPDADYLTAFLDIRRPDSQKPAFRLISTPARGSRSEIVCETDRGLLVDRYGREIV